MNRTTVPITKAATKIQNIFFTLHDDPISSSSESSHPSRLAVWRYRFGFNETRKLEPDRLGPSATFRESPIALIRGIDHEVAVDPETEETVESAAESKDR